MDIRRVQITGGSSFTISLPKEWVRDQGIGKNSPVGLDIRSDGNLVVYPDLDTDKNVRKKTLDLDNLGSELTFRMLIGAYIMGYSTMEITTKKAITDSVIESTREFAQKAIGPEIVEESGNRILVRDLLNPTKMPFEKTLERMYIIVRYMHNDIIGSIVNDTSSLIEDISARDLEVDRLNWLMAHQYNIINSLSVSNKMNISKEKAEFYFVSGRIVERIGDHAVQIARNSTFLENVNLPEGLKSAIKESSEFSIKMLDDSVNSWYNRDFKVANDTVDRSDDLEKMTEKVDAISLKMDQDAAIAVGRIADSIRRTGDYSTDIAENVINYLIRDM